jgi:hypothetical protein
MKGQSGPARGLNNIDPDTHRTQQFVHTWKLENNRPHQHGHHNLTDQILNMAGGIEVQPGGE